MSNAFRLNERAKAWISGLKSRFEAAEPSDAEPPRHPPQGPPGARGLQDTVGGAHLRLAGRDRAPVSEIHARGPAWPQMAGSVRGLLARVRGVVSVRRLPGQAWLRNLAEEAAATYAGALAHLRAAGRAGWRRRPGRPLPQPLPAAALHYGLLAGRLAGAGPGAGTQLRLPSGVLRGEPAPHLLAQAGHSHDRLRAGACSTASTTRASPSRSRSGAGRSWETASGYP